MTPTTPLSEAIRRYERDGLEASIEYHNNPENVDGQWYVFIVNGEGFTGSGQAPLRTGLGVVDVVAGAELDPAVGAVHIEAVATSMFLRKRASIWISSSVTSNAVGVVNLAEVVVLAVLTGFVPVALAHDAGELRAARYGNDLLERH